MTTTEPAKTSMGETARPEMDKNFVLRFGVRTQTFDGKWGFACNPEGKQYAFREFDPAFTLAENLVKNGEMMKTEVFTQRLYRIDPS